MTPRGHVLSIGRGASPVLVVDDATGAIDRVAAIAAAMAPFPPMRGNAYPGLRRYIAPADRAAADYARGLLALVAGPARDLFGIAGFDLIDASFSLVTTPPDRLRPEQRMPHFDSTDPAYLAIMHYVAGVDGSGTAFYRQTATGIEQVDDGNVARFVAAARAGAAGRHGYIGAGDAAFERTALLEGRADRLVVYRGALLHSGQIPADMAFSDDPRRGRLTANFFVRGRPPA